MLLWLAFGAAIIVLLALDLGIFHRKSHKIGLKEALIWSAIWIAVALAFNLAVYIWLGYDAALEFMASYIVERSLSFDNLFVFILVFSYFEVPAIHQYKVLFWGIVAALLLRGLFVLSGIELIEKFHWIMYLFGAFLIITGIKMALKRDKTEMDPSKNPVLKWSKKFLPTIEYYVGGNFFVKMDGRFLVTPLFLVLLVVETTDIIFALDSVPAVLGITLDPFIVYSSNIFAVLGLRALYFALAGCMLVFHYLGHGISLILIFIGAKMMLNGIYEIPVGIALGVIALILLAAIALSLFMPPRMASKPQLYAEEK
jgi:tellurite resistance protein TerC